MFCKLLFFVLVLFLFCCGGKQNGKTERAVNPHGKQLAESYCSSCHLHVKPEVLDRSSWVKVLIAMEKEMKKVSMQIEKEDWLDIQRYYLENAPLMLAQSNSKKRISSNTVFQKTNFLDTVPGALPFVTAINYDRERNVLYAGDVSGNVFEFNFTEYADKIRIANIPIHIEFAAGENSLEILGIGSLMPSEAMTGQLIRVDENGSQRIIIDSLKRPVHFTRKDLDGDGNAEYLISCFGSTLGQINTGKLAMFVLDNGVYKEKVIKELPGAIKSITGDFNNDKKPDIMAMFAQGKEIISMFLNRGNFEFEERVLLEFIPVYGSNSFELADINQDSYPDIVLTNGDNGDSSPVFKFYHGVRVFINDGSYRFTEKYFYPINGASKVLIRDFDSDGDLDMVVLAMFPDLFSWSEETIVYFENEGDVNFEPSYVEQEPSGKWFLMDTGDVDGDGDYDLILGTNYKVKPVLLPPEYRTKWDSSGISYRVFENTLF